MTHNPNQQAREIRELIDEARHRADERDRTNRDTFNAWIENVPGFEPDTTPPDTEPNPFDL